MARRHRHEEHTNHESWAIPYGDLVTLLLAFFVVMYSISSVNAGKYRVVSDSLNAAFRGAPTTPLPVQVGESAASAIAAPIVQLQPQEDVRQIALRQMARQLEGAMSPLIAQGLVDVHNGDGFIEVSIRSDILFGSGIALLSPDAQPVIRLLGETLRAFPNNIQVEGPYRQCADPHGPVHVQLGAVRRAGCERRAPAHRKRHRSGAIVGPGLWGVSPRAAEHHGRRPNRQSSRRDDDPGQRASTGSQS